MSIGESIIIPNDIKIEAITISITRNGKNIKNPIGSHPIVVAKCVEKIIISKRPKKRYLVGYGARSMLFIRNWFGDRFFEFILKLAGLKG